MILTWLMGPVGRWLMAGVAALGLAGGLYLRGRHDGAESVRAASLRQTVRLQRDAAKRAADQDAENRRIDDAHQRQIAALRADLRARPIGPVRLCVGPGRPAVPATGAAREPDGPAGRPEPGPPAGDPGPDIGGALQDYAEDAATCQRRLEGLQEWAGTRP